MATRSGYRPVYPRDGRARPRGPRRPRRGPALGRTHRAPDLGRHRRQGAPPLRSRHRRGRSHADAGQGRLRGSHLRPGPRARRARRPARDRRRPQRRARAAARHPARLPRAAGQRRRDRPGGSFLDRDHGRRRVAGQGRALPARRPGADHGDRAGRPLQRARLDRRPHVLRRHADPARRPARLRRRHRRGREPPPVRDDRRDRRLARRPRARRRGRAVARAVGRRAGAPLQPRRGASTRSSRSPPTTSPPAGSPASGCTSPPPRSPQPLGGSLFVAEPGVSGPPARAYAGP